MPYVVRIVKRRIGKPASSDIYNARSTAVSNRARRKVYFLLATATTVESASYIFVNPL